MTESGNKENGRKRKTAARKPRPAVSVLIPAYNVTPYIAQCLDSVMAQTWRDWEAIVIDDGSSDATFRICSDYASFDPRIRVERQRNAGLSATRNRMLDMARGEWIVFLDSDDVLPRYALDMMLRLANEHGCDIVGGNMLSFIKRVPEYSLPFALPRKMEPQEAVKAMLYQTDGPDTSSSAKIYRAKLWDDIRYRKGILYEDLDVIYQVVLKANSFLYVPVDFYFYRNTPGSILHTFSPRRLDVLDVTERIEQYMAETKSTLLAAARDRSLSAAFNILKLYAEEGVTDKAVERRCVKIIRHRRHETLFNREARRKNRIAAFLSYLIPRHSLPRLLRKAASRRKP